VVVRNEISAGDKTCEKTYTRRSTKIKKNSALLQESILLVQLNQLESSTGTVALFLRKSIPLIQTTFSVLEKVNTNAVEHARRDIPFSESPSWITGGLLRDLTALNAREIMSDRGCIPFVPSGSAEKKKSTYRSPPSGQACILASGRMQSPGTNEEHVT
jgi:hypothetical protein